MSFGSQFGSENSWADLDAKINAQFGDKRVGSKPIVDKTAKKLFKMGAETAQDTVNNMDTILNNLGDDLKQTAENITSGNGTTAENVVKNVTDKLNNAKIVLENVVQADADAGKVFSDTLNNLNKTAEELVKQSDNIFYNSVTYALQCNTLIKTIGLLVSTICFSIVTIYLHMYLKNCDIVYIFGMFLCTPLFVLVLINYMTPANSGATPENIAYANKICSTYNVDVFQKFAIRYGLPALILFTIFAYTHGQTTKYLNNSTTLLLVVYTTVSVLMANGAYYMSL